jgi:hypothetical protein
MWDSASARFPVLLEQLKPKHMIVLGRELWGNMPLETDIVISDDVQGYRLSDGDFALCWAVDHPSSSRALSWRGLASIIHFARAEVLRG